MGAYSTLTDSELVKRLADRDTAAVEEIYMRYFGGLFHHASKLLADREAGRDLVHDLFAYMIDHMGTLQINGPLDAYLYRATRNRVINVFHKNKNRQKYIEGLKHFFEKGETVTDDLILQNEMKRRIESAVAAFPPKLRETFEMSRKKEMSRREIAEATGTSESTVNNQINKALNILRTKLSCWFF